MPRLAPFLYRIFHSSGADGPARTAVGGPPDVQSSLLRCAGLAFGRGGSNPKPYPPPSLTPGAARTASGTASVASLDEAIVLVSTSNRRARGRRKVAARPGAGLGGVWRRQRRR